MGLPEETPPFIFIGFIVFQIQTLSLGQNGFLHIFYWNLLVSNVQVYKYIFK